MTLGARPGDGEIDAIAQAFALGRDDASLTAAILEAVRAHLGMDVAFLSEFVGDRQLFRALDGAGASFGLTDGGSIPLAASYCPRMTSGALPSAIPDVRADALVRDMAITTDGDVGAYVGVPVRLADGELYGTLCGLSHERVDVRDRDVAFLRVLAAILADALSRGGQRTPERRRHAEQVAAVVGSGSITIAFQPILRLADRRLIGVEALSRFDGHEPERPPDAWFALAWDIGLGERLELLAIRAALGAVEQLPDDVYVAVNADPRTVVSGDFRAALDGHDTQRVVVELTEHAQVGVYADLRSVMRALRREGVRFAVDDVGAGYAGLNHTVRVAPEVIKLDRFLASGVDTDPARRALVASAATFAGAIGMTLVAEGIETPAELAALEASGIHYGQGFLFGRPGPLADLPLAG